MTIALGKVVGVFGIKGWVKVFSETRPREQIFKYHPWILELNGSVIEAELVEGKAQGKGLIARLKGFTDCDRAKQLIGAVITVPEQALPVTGKDEYYWSQLVGLNVVNLQGINLGRVKSLFETGANDVMIVKGDGEHLIPFTRHAVIDVDLDSSTLTVDWDEDF